MTRSIATILICGLTVLAAIAALTAHADMFQPTPPVIRGTIIYGNAITSTTRFVSNVLISGVGSPNVSTTSADPGPTIGTYSLGGFGSGPYTVRPTKTGGVKNSINSFDAGRIAQHVIGNIVLTGNQLIVADVSGNGIINSFDAAYVASYVVNNPGPRGSTGKWIFIPVSRNYPSVTADVSGHDYTALLMGEVSGNWNHGSSGLVSGPERSTVISAPHLVTPPNNEVIVPVSIQGAVNKEIISYEFDLRFDPSVIQPQKDPIQLAGTVSRRLSFAANAEEAGRLRVAVYGAIPLDRDGVLLSLRFIATGKPGSVSPLTWERIMLNEGSPRVAANGQIELSVARSDGYQRRVSVQAPAPWHFLNFFPEPQ